MQNVLIRAGVLDCGRGSCMGLGLVSSTAGLCCLRLPCLQAHHTLFSHANPSKLQGVEVIYMEMSGGCTKLSWDDTTTETAHVNMTAPPLVQVQLTAIGQIMQRPAVHHTRQ